MPLAPVAPFGVLKDDVQDVVVLTYHRFGSEPNATTVTADQFRKQMAYLKNNDYRVISLDDLLQFRQGKKDLPRRAVMITVDDGYKSFYELAFPVLKYYGYSSTVFVYTDYVGKGGMNWNQLKELIDSGLVAVQSHSHTHANLATTKTELDDKSYQQFLLSEVIQPSEIIKENLAIENVSFAYPYGDTNQQVIELMENNDITLAMTVTSGSNTAFSPPYLLKRTMVLGYCEMKDFEEIIATGYRKNCKAE